MERIKVNFVDLPSQYEDIKDDIMVFFKNTVDKGAFVGGKALDEFESELADYVGVNHAVGCSNGTLALTLALIGAGIKKGDKVIVPTNSYIASANAVVHAGGDPVLVDCDPRSFLIDLNQAESALKKTGAVFIMPVHLYGNPCPMEEVLQLAEKYGAVVIEDNAQALGASYKNKKTGSFGVAAGVSFYPAKNLGAFGQGGAVLTNDKKLADVVRMYREQGQGGEKYYHDVVGYNGRLHSIQAGILKKLLQKLDTFNDARMQYADFYKQNLGAENMQTTTDDARHVYHLFEYRCKTKKQREVLADRLKESNIGFGYHYPVPIHKQKAYKQSNGLDLPVSEQLADTLISLPMHPSLTEEQLDYVCKTVSAE